jgi:hypothetical protein
MTSQLNLFDQHSATLTLTSSAVEPPASPTPSPAAAKAKRTRATSGRKWLESLPSSGPLGFFSRMFLTLPARLPTRYSETSKTLDIPSGHSCSVLRVSERRTGESDSSLWPTPDAAIFNDGQTVTAWLERKSRELRKGYNGNGGGTPLAMAAAIEESKLWPSPNARDAHGARRATARTEEWTSNPGETLLDVALTSPSGEKLWASPIARNAHGAKGVAAKEAHGGEDLVSQAREAEMWPTPRSSEWKGVGPIGSKSHDYRPEKGYLDATVQEQESVEKSPTNGRALNPDWVECLMGFPVGWTEPDGPPSAEQRSTLGSRPV